jgi:sugar phosphate isomerase/epimerase
MASRRSFLKTSALGVSATGLFPLSGLVAPARSFFGNVSRDALPVGIAGYTFHNYGIEQSIAMMKRVNATYMSLKDFHLPLNSTPEKIDEVMAIFRSAGITIYAVGVIYIKSNAEADQAFEYAKKVGVGLIIGSPTYEMLPYVEQKVKAYNIKMAIHNHGPEDKWYPGPKDIYERISQMDPGMGICLDIGHATRAGVDPVKAVGMYSSRIFDLHIKDQADASPAENPVELGRGIMDIPGLITALKKIQYAGKCSIEFELPAKDPLPGIAESVGFLRGVIRGVNG